MNVYKSIIENSSKGKKQFAVLIDPDKVTSNEAAVLAARCNEAKVDFIFVGGSLLTNGNLSLCINVLKENSAAPVVLFPGNVLQIDEHADALLFLSLISGRNPDLLIGKHVIAAPLLKEKKIETIPTGYMLIDSGKMTTALYMSNTHPIPHSKIDIAACTALAGEMLGLKLIYMDGGSGALNPISEEMIAAVRKQISLPIIVGGGIKTKDKAIANCKAGADIIVVGNAIESDFNLIKEIADAVHGA